MGSTWAAEPAWGELAAGAEGLSQPTDRRSPRLAGASIGLAGLAWISWAATGRHSIVSPAATSGILVANVAATRAWPGLKLQLIRAWQRYVLNPAVRVLLAIGVVPLGISLLETTGRHSGKPRRNPVGEGRQGETFWIIAEHGHQANYVRNMASNPHVRVKIRAGLRTRWREGVAQILVDEDPYELQRQLCRWHPLRAFNAAMVRVMGTDLVVIRVDLSPK